MGVLRRGKDPSAWWLRYDEPVEPGQPRKQIRVAFTGTKKEAVARLAKILAAAKSGRSTGTRGRTPFRTFADAWLKDRREQIMLRPDDALSPYTVTIDESRVRQHIIPVLGRYRMDAMGPKEITSAIRTWKNTPLQRGRVGLLSPKSVSNLYIVLRKMLNDAVAWNYIEWNPCERAEKPPGGTRKIVATPLADAAKLLAYPSLAPVHVACITELFTGLRRGEILALRREDLDLEQGTVFCEKAIALWERAIVVKPVKTQNDRGRRLQPLAPILAALLRAYVDHNPTIAGPLFAARGQEERWSAKPWTPRAFSAAVARHMAKVGIVANSQSLRHAFNSLQNAAGVERGMRAVLMGHADSSRMTDVNYLTVWLADKRAAVQALQNLLTDAPSLPAVNWEEPPPFSE